MSQETRDHRRAAAERSIEAILDATERLLARHADPNVSAVAEEAGVSRPTFYAHFPTREDLLEAVAERAVGRSVAAIEQAALDEGTPLDALERLVSASWRELERHAAIAAASSSFLSGEAMRRSHHAVRGPIGDLIDRGRAEHAFRDDLTADWLTTMLLATMHAAADDVRARRMKAADAPGVVLTTVRSLLAPPG